MSGDSGASRRAAMYGENDLSSLAIFSGNYINYGYWQNFTPGLISIDERTESQANLYRTVLRHLKIDPTDVALEVGAVLQWGQHSHFENSVHAPFTGSTSPHIRSTAPPGSTPIWSHYNPTGSYSSKAPR